ncbi:hypothetical protein [uncultured Clostridium sp.]|uniref:hypothetical protein n=1 Tax=uncultured Clostridium sp. TaxID=59620 RepID=UPI0026724232|nr:hypothetical protein [uncultured Clostridium sp.]
MLRVNSKYKERKGTWKMIMMLSLIVVLILILFLYNKDIFHRDTVITIVTNLPLGIFKDENKKKMEQKDMIHIILTAEENNIIERIKKDENNIKTEQVINEAPLAKIEADEKVEEIVESNESIEFPEEKEIIVYWTPNGKNYHMKNTCRTLARSKVILSGNTLECEKAICCEHCKIEEDKNKI